MKFFMILSLIFFYETVLSENYTTFNINLKTYSQQEILNTANDFFGQEYKGLDGVINKIFSDLGNPSAYIVGSEDVGTAGVGLRYGVGKFYQKSGEESEVYWRGPSIGFNSGGRSPKVLVLIYNLEELKNLFKRFPSGENNFFYTARVGVSYKQKDKIIIVPIRTGERLTEGINVGWIKYSPRKSIEPF